MVEKFRQIIGNSAKHCLAFSAGAGPQTILPRISQSTLVQAALRETYCVTKTSNSTRRQRYRLLSCPYIWSAHYIFSPIYFTNFLHEYYVIFVLRVFFNYSKLRIKSLLEPNKRLPNWEIFVIFVEKNGEKIWWADQS
jgi:hypothetical protein